MANSMEKITRSLITWLQTFGVQAPHLKVSELSDGVAIAQVLTQIAPDYFTPIWISKIKPVENWRLKGSNLKKIFQGIMDYYNEELGQQISDFTMPNISKIAEHNDITELGRLLQLVLGCAVNCNHKQEYIEAIMGLEEHVQHDVMNCIQELMTKEIPSGATGDSLTDLEEKLKRALGEVQTARDDKEHIMQRCHELDIQVAVLQEEKMGLANENEKLLERLNHIESLEDPNTVAGRRFQQMQHKLDILQDEVFKLETVRDEYRIKAESLQKEVLDLQQKNEELQKCAEDSRSLKDELDALRHTSHKVGEYEEKFEMYKKRLGEMAELKRQIKVLQDKNTAYVENNLELEEELKRSSSLKSQADMYKKQAQELQGKLSEEIRRADKSEFESKRLNEKYNSLLKEKERLAVEKASLGETIEELKCLLVQNENSGKEDKRLGPMSDSEFLDSLPPEYKEKMLRLQHENKMLKLKQNTNDDQQTALLQSMLDDSKARQNELEIEIRFANQRILELEGSIQDLQESQSSASNQEGVELRQQMSLVSRQLKEAQDEVLRHKQTAERAQAHLKESENKVLHLQETLNKKDEEMKAMDERHKKYLEKAKNVYKAMDPSANVGPDVMALRNQIHERDKVIANLEREAERTKSINELEERLITTAFYNLGSHLQRRAAEDRLRSTMTSTPQTFLSRQRQATSKRLTMPGVAASEFFDH